MLALFSTAFILLGAPAILLFAGRLIQSKTDAIHGAKPVTTVLSGTEWYFRQPHRVFGQNAILGAQAVETPAPATAVREVDHWFYRPMRPLVVWPDLRWPFRRPRNAQRA